MQVFTFPPGDYICRDNEPASHFYFVVQGRVKVIQKNTTHKHNERFLYPHKFFGEIALLHNACKWTSNCTSDEKYGATVLCLTKLQFDTLSSTTSPESKDTTDEATAQTHSVVEAMKRRQDTTKGVEDYSFCSNVFLRFQISTVARRMLDIMTAVTVHVAQQSSRKMAIAIVLREILHTPIGTRTKEQICFLMCILSETLFYKRHLHCSSNQTAELCQHLHYRAVRKSTCVHTIGELGTDISIVLSGQLTRLSLVDGVDLGNRNSTAEVTVKKSTIGCGAAAGTVALQNVQIRIDSVVAKLDTEIMVLDAQHWLSVRGLGRGLTLTARLQCLQKCPLFVDWNSSALTALNFVCEEYLVSKGTCLDLTIGRRGLYIVVGTGQISISMPRAHASTHNKQLCHSTVLTDSSPFSLYDVLEKPIASAMQATALTQCYVLKIPRSQYSYLTEDKYRETLNCIKALYANRVQTTEDLYQNTVRVHTSIFVPMTDTTKWLEMKESKRTEAVPAPIVNCVLQKKEQSIVAKILAHERQDNPYSLSAATGIEHGRNQSTQGKQGKQGGNQAGNQGKQNSKTASFDRANLFQVRCCCY